MKVYMTKRNAKWNEGRGPMVNDKCFINGNHVILSKRFDRERMLLRWETLSSAYKETFGKKF